MLTKEDRREITRQRSTRPEVDSVHDRAPVEDNEDDWGAALDRFSNSESFVKVLDEVVIVDRKALMYLLTDVAYIERTGCAILAVNRGQHALASAIEKRRAPQWPQLKLPSTFRETMLKISAKEDEDET